MSEPLDPAAIRESAEAAIATGVVGPFFSQVVAALDELTRLRADLDQTRGQLRASSTNEARFSDEIAALRAAEQRVRALADQWRFWPTMSTTVDELLAALDGGQP